MATLEAVGLPATVLNGQGRVLAANALLGELSPVLLPLAHGGLAIAAPAANTLFREAVAASSRDRSRTVRSIPVPTRDDRPALVVHVLPLCGAAHDIFSGAETLVVVSVLRPPETPSATLLDGLFDLTPAEARLVRGLAEGHTIGELADMLDVSRNTLRTQLAHAFAKTGTNRQAELLGLLAGIRHTSPANGRQMREGHGDGHSLA